MCKYCEYESDDRPCCEACYLNRKSHIVFYKDLYRKSNFLCEGCIELYYYKRRQEMLGISKIVSIKEYNATHKKYCDKCELCKWIILYISKMEISIYYVMDALGSSYS